MEVLQTPVKSLNDKKNYRLIKLKNGLKALLISMPDIDEEKSISAASLCVFVGSYDNPSHVNGLAHFFEHMIFLDPGNYDKNFKEFIESHGGYCNAMTANDFTDYQFKINDEKFSEALRRFAEMFISPVLNKDHMQNERVNVDSEFRLSKLNPMVRRAHLHRLYLNQEHHASRFPTGNLRTLKDNISDDILHEELVKFFENYVANKMALCVQSSKSLDELQQQVVDNFSTIKKNDSIRFNYELPVNFDELIKPEFYSKILYIKDTSENALAFTWLLPPVSGHYKSKPLDIISRIIQNSDEGGLETYLKEKNLMTYLSFTYQTWLSSKQFTCLRLEIDLTDEGAERIEEILTAVYSYLLMLKNVQPEDYQRLFNDIREDLEQHFKYMSDESALDNVSVARYMNTFDDVDILRGQYTLMEYDEEVLMDYINRLNENKFNITIFTKDRQNLRLREEMYDIQYDEEDLPDNLKILWNERKLNSQFFLELPNPYKIKNLEIFTDHEELDHPEKIFKNEIIEIWHMLDSTFKQPKAKIEMFLITKEHGKSVETYAYMKLLQKIATEMFDKRFSKIYKAGISNNLGCDFDYFYFTFDGYNDKMLMMIEETFVEFKNILENLDESKFNKKLEYYKKNVKESLYFPQRVGSDELKKILSNKYFTDFDISRVLDSLSFDNFKKAVKEMFSQLKATALVQGNMRKEDAYKISLLFLNNFDCQQLDAENQLTSRGYKIPKGSHTLRLKASHPTDDNSLILNYYQSGPYAIREQNLAVMLKSYLDSKAFDFLRTKLQLSYNVGFTQMKLEKVIGFGLVVRSNEENNDFLKVYGKMEEFINVLCRQYIAEITDEEFQMIKNGRITALSEPNLTLGTEFQVNMREIKEQTYNFNRTNESIEDAKKIVKTDLQTYFHSVFGPENMRKLNIQVIGKRKSEITDNIPDEYPKRHVMVEKMEIDEHIITDIDEFKKYLTLYPINYN